MNEFLFNVLNNTAGRAKKLKLHSTLNKRDSVIISDEHQLSYLLCATLMMMKKADSETSVSLVVNGSAAYPESLAPILEDYPEINVYTSIDEYFENRSERDLSIFHFANLRNPLAASPEYQKEKLRQIDKILDSCAEHKSDCYQLITCIPSIEQPLPDVTNAVAEREYEVIFRDYPEDSLEKYVIRLEDHLRARTEQLSQIQVIRLDRVYGPGISESDGIWVMDIIRDIFTNGTVTIYDRDRHDIASAAFVRDAVLGILIGMATGRKGNIYQISSHKLSRFQIITNLLNKFPEQHCDIETVHGGWDSGKPDEYRMLNPRKLRLANRAKLDKVLYTAATDALPQTAYWYQDTQGFIPTSTDNVYYGRMPRIREIELDILNEVDAICKENNINYFLTAGTMLGAVRHKGFIPWDDDVDIGMLPEDYFKFLKICPNHLSMDYGYQNFGTEKTSHYIHDKIRVKNSFFSTKYSNKYAMMNGVYIDVFVYFKTSDKPFLQKFHLWYINAMRRVIGLRWADYPRKNIHYRLSKIVLPALRKIPFDCIHKYYIHVLSWFEKLNTHYRVDSMGFNLKKVGAVPDEWFHGTVEAEFAGKKYPILAHYDEFLSHWYGQHYMELLPVSKRQSVHDVVRIDLGQTLFNETMHDPAFRDVDLRGELYETYKTQEVTRGEE